MTHHTTDTSTTDTSTTEPDAWRGVWIDPDTARINARRDEIQHDADDMAEYFAMCRAAIS